MSIHTWFVDEAGRMEARKVTAAELRQACEEEFGVKTYTREEVLAAVEGAFEDVHGQGSQLGLGLLLRAVGGRLGPRYVVRQEPESGWRYYSRVMWAVYDNHEARDLAFCPQIEEANVIAELLNKDAA